MSHVLFPFSKSEKKKLYKSLILAERLVKQNTSVSRVCNARTTEIGIVPQNCANFGGPSITHDKFTLCYILNSMLL